MHKTQMQAIVTAVTCMKASVSLICVYISVFFGYFVGRLQELSDTLQQVG